MAACSGLFAFLGQLMSDQQQIIDPVRPYVARQIKEAGWGPFEAINWAFDRDRVERFRAVAMFVRLCADPIARAEPIHVELHRRYNIHGCVGPELMLLTQKSLGISDERARYLLDQLDAEHHMAAGLGALSGGG